MGRYSISPNLNSTFEYLLPYFALVSLALQIISGVASTPIALPLSPTIWEALKISIPPPLPRSTTTSPTLGLMSNNGDPHPALIEEASTGIDSPSDMRPESLQQAP